MKCELFNSGWKFWEDKDSFALIWSVPDNAQDITLPHDAMLYKHPYAESLNGRSTGFRDGGSYIYVNSLFVPQTDEDKVITLKFEGMYMNALVYVNGQLSAKCPYGYTTFYAPLSPYLRYEQYNEIRVIVKNSGMPNSRWYSGSGIYRDVYLLTSGQCYLKPDEFRVTAESGGIVRINAEVEGGDGDESVHIELYDAENILIGKGDCVLNGASRSEYTANIQTQTPKLWSDESPYLYKCKAVLKKDGISADEESAVFGFRTLDLDAKNGLRVNGRPVKLRGACIHHDNGPIGAAEYDGAAFRRIRKLKEAGFNAVRMSHHPISHNLLRACDALGMYVMDEAFDMWTRTKSHMDYALYFNEWWRSDLSSMIKKDYNHPCVIMYSLGNEIPEIGMTQGLSILKEMIQTIRSLDTTRYTLCGINGVFAAGDKIEKITSDVSLLIPESRRGGNVNDFLSLMDKHMDKIVSHNAITSILEKCCALTDIAGYNYMTGRYKSDNLNYPDRVIVGSETYPPEISRNWELVKELPSVIGDFTWTGWDYLGEAGIGVVAYQSGGGGFGAQYPCQIAYCGDFDITGFRRPASYYREIVFGLRKKPYISVQNPRYYGENPVKTPWVLSDSVSSWNWRGYEGKPVIVEVYSSADEVELLLNGMSLGRKPAGEKNRHMALFETVYGNGTLRAINYRGGNKAEVFDLLQAEGSLSAVLNVYSEGELVYAEAELRGDNGEIYTDSDRSLTLEWNSSLTLLGFCGGDPKTKDFYPDATGATYNGRALAVFRRTAGAASGNVTDDIKITIKE